jgi:uncharacterized membrane protein YfhO
VAVSEGYDAGWQARLVGGGPLRVHRLDALILGVEVPAGACQVELSYEPPRWRPGLAGSLVAFLALAGWAWRDRRRHRGGAHADD